MEILLGKKMCDSPFSTHNCFGQKMHKKNRCIERKWEIVQVREVKRNTREWKAGVGGLWLCRGAVKRILSFHLPDIEAKKLQMYDWIKSVNINIKPDYWNFRLGHSAVASGTRPVQGGTQGPWQDWFCFQMPTNKKAPRWGFVCVTALISADDKATKPTHLLRYDNHHKRADDCSCKTGGKNT